MLISRRGAIQSIDEVIPDVERKLVSAGFVRTGDLFHRNITAGDVTDRIEGVSLRFEYGFRTCWLRVTVKYPRLLELLAEVRPFAYRRELAWAVPDFASHLCSVLRTGDLTPELSASLPTGMRVRDDGRLQRARSVPAATLGRVMLDLVEGYALPALQQRLTLNAVAAACDLPGYPDCGIAGAWPLAARIALDDKEGAARAFRSHPYSLGSDLSRFCAGREWLLGKDVEVASVKWVQADAERSNSRDGNAWLSGESL